MLLLHILSHLCQVVLCRNLSLGLTRADSFYSAMAALNTALTVQMRWMLGNWEVDLTANKNLKFLEKENSSEVEKTENKYLRLSPLLKGKVNLLCATHLLLGSCRVAGRKKNLKNTPNKGMEFRCFLEAVFKHKRQGKLWWETQQNMSSPHGHQEIVHTSFRHVCFLQRVNISQCNLFTV